MDGAEGSVQEWSWMRRLEEAVREIANDLAIILVFDRPERVDDRPGLASTYFAERCASIDELNSIASALREVGVYVELYSDERSFVAALADGRHQISGRSVSMVYNGVEGGVSEGGFLPGRKALIPTLCDAYDVLCSNSNPLACALGRHKFHYFTALSAAGLPVPQTWHYRLGTGWAGNRMPTVGTQVIVKSTYESWSVGVTEDSKFVCGADTEDRVSHIAEQIGQAVTVQEFVAGPEVEVTVFAVPERLTAPPALSVLTKAPDDFEAIVTLDDNLRGGALTYAPFVGPSDLLASLDQLAIEAFEALDLGVFARIDFRVDSEGQPWITDVGVSPALGLNSSSWESARQVGLKHGEFVRAVFGATLASAGVVPSPLASTRLPEE